MVQNANAKSALYVDNFLEAQKEILPRKGFILCSPSSVLYNTNMHICQKNQQMSHWGSKASEDSVVPALLCTWHLCWVGSEVGFGFWGVFQGGSSPYISLGQLHIRFRTKGTDCRILVATAALEGHGKLCSFTL